MWRDLSSRSRFAHVERTCVGCWRLGDLTSCGSERGRENCALLLLERPFLEVLTILMRDLLEIHTIRIVGEEVARESASTYWGLAVKLIANASPKGPHRLQFLLGQDGTPEICQASSALHTSE